MSTKLLLTVAVVLTLPLAACSGDGATSAPSTGTTSTAGSAGVTPSAEPSVTPTVTPTPVRPTTRPAVPTPRTAAQLRKALLALADLPSGFSVEPADESGPDPKATSKQAACARLVVLTNAEHPPGSRAGAEQAFSAGQEGPFIDETLDAMGSTQAVAALQRSFRTAIRSCRKLTLSVPGEGRSTVTVREISAPQSGTDPVAVRFNADNGPLEGLELTLVSTGVNDVVLGLTIVAGLPEDIDGATEAAVDKAEEVLGGAKTGT